MFSMFKRPSHPSNYVKCLGWVGSIGGTLCVAVPAATGVIAATHPALIAGVVAATGSAVGSAVGAAAVYMGPPYYYG